MTGICFPFVACGELSSAQPHIENDTLSRYKEEIKPQKSPSLYMEKEVIINNQKRKNLNNNNLTREEHQKINNLVYPMLGKSGGTQEQIINFINSYNPEPQKQAKIIAEIIKMSTHGVWTYKPGIRAGIYSINNNTLNSVNSIIKNDLGLTLKEFIDDEFYQSDANDLHRHINQFKK